MGGTGDGGLSESLLRDDHPRLVLGRVSNEPGEQLPWGWPCAFHTLSAVVGIAGLVWHCVRLHADPCQGTAAEQLCGPDGPVGDKYWLLKAGVLLSTWELLLQGGYFVSAAGCDWMVGHEATLLGLKPPAPSIPDIVDHSQGHIVPVVTDSSAVAATRKVLQTLLALARAIRAPRMWIGYSAFILMGLPAHGNAAVCLRR